MQAREIGIRRIFALHKVENIIILQPSEQAKERERKSVNLFYLHSQSLESTSIIN
jgi:hypothetical protein